MPAVLLLLVARVVARAAQCTLLASRSREVELALSLAMRVVRGENLAVYLEAMKLFASIECRLRFADAQRLPRWVGLCGGRRLFASIECS
jgi:hypothetical protein